jgi:DNA ligase (NAD+)
LDIEGLGEKTITIFLEKGLLQDLASIYTLKKADITPLEGFGELSADNLVTAIENTRTPPLHRFLYGLGIPNVGETTAADIARFFGTFAAIRTATPDQLLQVEGVGPIVARSIVEFFANSSVNTELESLLQQVTPDTTVAEEIPEKEFSGKTFVFTGTLERLTRSEAKKQVEGLGGKVSSSVSRNTDYVVYGPGARSKLAKARELGMQLLTEEEFLALLGKPGE